MKKLPFPITRDTYEKHVSEWLTIIASGESGSVLFFPKTDRLRRIPQFIADVDLFKKHLPNYKDFHFLLLDLELFPIEELEDLEEFVISQFNKSNIGKSFQSIKKWADYLTENDLHFVLIVPNAERLLEPLYHTIFVLLDDLTRKSTRIQLLLFFERDILHPNYSKLFASRTTFLQNVVYYPIYSEGDTSRFIYYLLCKWNIRISKKLTLEIIEQCGGHFWLVKEAVRFYRQAGDERYIFNHDEMHFRLEVLYESLSESEKSLLKKIVFNQTEFDHLEKHSLTFLQKVRLLSENNSFTIGLLYDYIKNLEEKRPDISVSNGSLLLNNVPIHTLFSKKELRVIKGFLNNENKILSRDEVSRFIWPVNTSEYYSDWAIDQLITRLRKRLEKLYIPKSALKTIRGKGYLFSFNKPT